MDPRTTTFTHSAELADLGTALAKAQAVMEGARRSSKNPHLRTAYSDLASVWDACQDALNTNGLSIIQGVGSRVVDGQNYITVATMMLHASGQWVRSELEMPYAEQKGISLAQAAGSVTTYCRRYGLQGMVSQPSVDDDGQSGGGKSPKPQPPAEPPATDWQAACLAAAKKAKLPDGAVTEYVAYKLTCPVESVDYAAMNPTRWKQIIAWIEDGTITKWANENVPS